MTSVKKILNNNSNNYNNDLQQSSQQSWLCCSSNVNVLKNKILMKNNVLHNNHSHHNHSHDDDDDQQEELERKQYYSSNYNSINSEIKPYRYVSESEKDNMLKNNYDNKIIKISFRTRSESEPSDIRNLKYMSSSNNYNNGNGDSDITYDKINQNEQQFYLEGKQQKYSSSKLLPKHPQYNYNHSGLNGNKKVTNLQSPSLYCQKPPLGREQHNIEQQHQEHRHKQQQLLRTSLISSVINETSNKNISSLTAAADGRSRVKSPSQIYKKDKNYVSTMNATSSVPFRESKSLTPPPRKDHLLSPSQSLPQSDERFALKNDKNLLKIPQCSVLSKDMSNLNDEYNDEDEEDFDDDFDDNDDEDVNSSSDSEDDYRASAYSTNFEKSASSLSYQLMQQKNLSINITNFVPPLSPLIPSLFPNVPPYLAFSTDTEKGPQLPNQVHKILKWKLTKIMPKVVRRILINSGFRLLKKTNEWMGTWGKHMKSPCFRAIRSYQKVNHLPGSFKIGRKDSCWRNLKLQMARHGKREFGFMPKTYIIPQDLKILRKTWPKYAQKNFKWIIKPPASARGTGIRVVNKWSQIPKRRSVIVQKYIERPFLINHSKFDLRLYVLVTSISPLRVYLYHDGLVRFASVKYSEKSDTLHDRCMHLTNYSINKFSSNYAKNDNVYACHGHKWTIKSLWQYFEKRGINTARLWSAFRNLILRTLLAGENSIYSMMKLNVESKYNCFELFGFDVLLDSELIPWLLEVNISPSLHSELPLDLHVKAPLVQAVLNTALFNIPPKLSSDQQKELLNRHGLHGPLCYDKRLYITYLSKAEKFKHQQFTKKSLEDRDEYLTTILEDLTPDDVRCLIVAEDELSRSTPLERIFPTQYTHKYLKYTEMPRYYNRLLDAWEHKYSKNRQVGINLLKELCEKKLHLDTPPAPMKKDSNVDDKKKNNDKSKQQVQQQQQPNKDSDNRNDGNIKSIEIINENCINNSNDNVINTTSVKCSEIN